MNQVLRGVLTAILVTSACAGRLPPVEAANERVKRSVERGEGASRGGSYALAVRHNPTRCECPAYEVLVRGAWTRAFVDGAPAILEQLSAGASLQAVTLQGKVSDEERAAADRVLYPVFVTDSGK